MSQLGEILFFAIYLIFASMITAINCKPHRLIPDKIVFAMAAAGVPMILLVRSDHIGNHAMGALLGAIGPYLLAWIYWKLTKEFGIGLGVVKYSATVGLWTGAWGAITTLGILATLVLINTIPLLRPLAFYRSFPASVFVTFGGLIWLLVIYWSPFTQFLGYAV